MSSSEERASGPPSLPAYSVDGEATVEAEPAPDADRYVEEGVLGHGGMGRVVLVRDRRLRRTVARKEPPPDASPVVAARLVREAHITARLDHPGIVPVHDVGRTPDGRPFYTMRAVHGRTLGAAIRAAGDLPARLRLLRHVLDTCHAVAYAHGVGVLHRDLKPENILVGELGETQVADWGLARPLDDPPAGPHASAPRAPDLATVPAPSTTGGLVGGAGAAPPVDEARPDTGSPDCREAAAGLGAGSRAGGGRHASETSGGEPSSRFPSPTDLDGILEVAPFEPDATVFGVVVGTPAYMSPEQARGEALDVRSDVFSLGAILYELLTGGPPFTGRSPAEILAQVRAGRVPPVRDRAPAAPPELCAVAERATAPAPEDRYASAQALSADLARYLDGRLVEAHAYTPWEHLRRFASVWRAPLLVAGVAVVAGFALVLAGSARVAGERNRALAAEADARAALARADADLAQALLAAARQAAASGARPEMELLAARAVDLGGLAEARGLLASTALAPRPRRDPLGPAPACDRVRLAGDASAAACLSADGLSVWSTTGERRWQRPGLVTDAAFLGVERLALIEGPARTLRLVDARSGADLEAFGTLHEPRGLTTGRVGRHVLVRMMRWVLVEGRGERHVYEHPCGATASVVAAAWSPGDARWAVACSDGRLLGAAPGADPAVLASTPFGSQHAEISAMDFLPDGRLALGTLRGPVALLDPRSGAWSWVDPALGDRVLDVRAAPDGRSVLVVGEARGPRVLPVDRVVAAPPVQFPATDRRAAAFAADGRVVTVGRRFQAWRLPDVTPIVALASDLGLSTAAVSPDGRWIALARSDGRVRVHAIADPEVVHEIVGPAHVAKAAAFSPDGARLAVGLGEPAAVGIHDTRTFARQALLGRAGFRPRRLAWLGADRLIVPSFGTAAALLGPEGERLVDHGPARSLDLAGTPDGRRVALLDDAGGVRVFSDDGSADPVRWEAPGALAVALTPSGDALALLRDGAVTVHRPAGGAAFERYEVPTRGTDVALSDHAVAVGAPDGAVVAFRRRTSIPWATIREHRERVSAVVFESDDVIVSASWDRTARRLGLGPHVLGLEALSEAWGLSAEEAMGAATVVPRGP